MQPMRCGFTFCAQILRVFTQIGRLPKAIFGIAACRGSRRLMIRASIGHPRQQKAAASQHLRSRVQPQKGLARGKRLGQADRACAFIRFGNYKSSEGLYELAPAMAIDHRDGVRVSRVCPPGRCRRTQRIKNDQGARPSEYPGLAATAIA